MALTLTEGNKYSITSLEKWVIDRLVKDSEILEHLPFRSLMGNSLTYDTVTTRSGAAFYNVNDTIVESTPTLTQATVTLTKLIGDADIDNLISRTRSNIIDVKAEVVNDKVKAIQEAFLDQFYYGTLADAKGFSGLHSLMTSTTYNTVHAGATTGTALSMAKLYEACDLPTGFKPSHIAMSKKMRRLIQVYLDSIGEKYPTQRDQYGKLVEYFQGMKIIVDDHIVNAETAVSGAFTALSGGNCTSIFILTFAPQACCGVQGSNGVEIIDKGDLETKDARRYRVRWYPGIMLQNIRSCAKVDGILTTGAVTA